jgi:hypothetical protein
VIGEIMTHEVINALEENFFRQDVNIIKKHYNGSKAYQCCNDEHCIKNRKVAGRKGLINNNTKNKNKK